MKVLQLLSELTVYFDGSQNAAGSPMYGGEALGKRFEFNEVSTIQRADGIPCWIAKQGRHGEHRIYQAHGNDIELSVTLDLTKAKREMASVQTVLEEMWSYLWKTSEEGAAPSIDGLGTVLDGTLAVLETDESFEQIVPPARSMREAAVAHLGSSIVSSVAASSLVFRFSIDINITVGQRLMLRRVTLEPRTTSRPNVHVLFTQSPLPFDKHLIMVRSVLPKTPASKH
jgi:hypothetical protein